MELQLLAVLLLLMIQCASRAVSEQRAVRFEMREELRPPARIGSLSNSTAGARAASFRLVSAAVPFLRVSEGDGALTLTERVDREALCRRSARCVLALDVALVSGERFELLRVEVEVLDVNDHAPEFPSPELALEVSEAVPLGTRLPVDPAHDPDSGTNSVQSYRLLAGGPFTVETVTRVDGVRYAELVLVRPLDRETQDVHLLQLEAADGGRPPRTGSTNLTVRVLDSNDNSPAFERGLYTVELPEDAVSGHLLLRLHASDPDQGPNGQVVFDFSKQTGAEVRQLFRLDRRSGRLTLGSTVDFEEQTAYEIDVQAADLGAIPAPPTTCKVIIHLQDVNDNRPVVSVAPVAPAPDGAARVSEGAGPDALVAVVTISDRDSGENGRVACSLQGALGHFRLRRAYEGSYAIVTVGGLDREKIAQYNLTVVAEDFGTPSLRTVVQYTIMVMDVNDNVPVFSAKTNEGFIEENQLPGTYITTVVASDPDVGLNGEVTYELLDSDTDAPSRFAIMNQAGHVYALQSFNHEVTPRLELRVQASDRGWPQLKSSTVLVVNVVDQNDNVPAVTQPVLQNGTAEVLLPREAGPGYVVTQVKARDADTGSNAQLTYRLVGGADLGFSIDQDTGEIYMSRKVSYDTNEEPRVTVTVSDNGIPSLTSTATIRFTFTESAPSNDNYYSDRDKEEPGRWASAAFVLIFTLTSSSLLLLVSFFVYFFCSRKKSKKRQETQDPADRPYAEKENNVISLISSQTATVFNAHTLTGRVATGSAEIIHSSVEASSDSVESTLLYKPKYRTGVGQMDAYSTLPGYGKDSARHVTVWKGNSMVTVAARDPHISGKDSGKGDSDINDSDSDISREGARKDYSSYKGLWACTSECRVLGHSDRCWSPSATRPSGAPHLSTFSRAAPSPLNGRQVPVYYECPASQTGTGALQSAAESRRGQCDYIHIRSPEPPRRTGSAAPEALARSTEPIPANSPRRFADA